MGGHNKIGVFGLGAMGYGMAQSLLRAGHAVHGFDLNGDAVTRLQAEGAATAPPAEVAADLDAVVIVVLNAAQTEAVLFGETGIAPALRKGAVVMACATVAPDFARAMAARCAENGLHYLDAPISGGMARAATGDLAIMASGAPEAFAAAGPILDATASTVHHMGDAVGAGSAMKAVNQILAGVHIATMAEAYNVLIAPHNP
ncbi:MAG: NAD(P)-binding domain-containing protein, partial [Pseudomonadota bacterium]